MNEVAEIQTAHRFLWKWTGIILAYAFVGTALLIWWGENHNDYWASWDTINGSPSLEIVP